MKKRKLCLVLTLTISCMLGGCQEETAVFHDVEVNKTGYPVVAEPLTLTLFGSKAPIHGDWSKMMFFTEMEKLTNIKFNFITPSDDSAIEKRNLAFASGDLPDLFLSTQFTSSELMTYAKDNQIIALDSYIDEYCPNLKKVLDAYPDIRKDLTAPDGHIYGLRKMNISLDPPGAISRFFINTKWLDTLGMSIPKTTEEFYDAMKAFKEKDPNGNGEADEIPLSLTGTWQFNWLAGAFGVLPHDNGIYDEDGTIIYAYSDDRYKEYVRWLHRLYRDGLLDPDSFAQSQPQLYAKGRDGLLGSFFTALPFVVCGEEKNDWYDWQPALIGPEGTQLYIGGASYADERANFVITTKNPYPEATMRWVDHLFTREANMLMTFGIENISYKLNDDGLYEKIVPEAYDNFDEYRGKEITPVAGGSLPSGTIPNAEQRTLFTDSVLNESYKEKDRVAYGPYLKPRYPILYFSAEDSQEIAGLTVDLNSYVENMRAQFIMGTMSIDEKWDEYCAQINKIGGDKLVEYYQKSLDARNAELQ